MEKIQEFFNFDNIGGKIKNLAKWSCWITIFLLWVATPLAIAISLAAEGLDAIASILLFPLGALIASFATWIGWWGIYALGEFVEDLHAIRDKEGTTKEVAAKHEAEMKAKREAEERAIREAEQLSISDIESATSAFLKRRVSISDINCTLIYVIPKSTGKPKEMHLDMSVGDTEFTSLDLFFDQKRKAYFFKDRQLALDGAWRSAEEIFGFDVALFKAFDTQVDEDD